MAFLGVLMPWIEGCEQPTWCSEEAVKESLSHAPCLTRAGHNQTQLKQPHMQAETVLNNQTFWVAFPSAFPARRQ